MKKRFMSSLSVIVLSMTLIFNLSVSAQSKSEGPSVGSVSNANVAAAQANQNSQKQITRAQFEQLSGEAQHEYLSNTESVNISDLVNATPADLEQRKDKVFYVAAADFNSLPADKKWNILKNPGTYIVVQDAAQIPKIQITREQYDAMPQEKKSIIRNSPDYIIIN